MLTSIVIATHDAGEMLLDAPHGAARTDMLEAIASLLRTLARVGARHPDLNVKNILLTVDSDGPLHAYVLDVDRIVFGTPDDARIAQANVKRLTRSFRKWRDHRQVTVSEEELSWLATAATRSEP